eukprot:gnl/Spiro4/24115_TR11961_c0_g1_i1.p1 gnl/Spiro4/24115_TR11961_c0_g1~~gnl/Spiro4/24115_TR11961_c0_g1_i1.p1  ORF type:complete len:363 (-),score=93.33 gnl/Spiro4/24115_TR11961_c0_g1_i1:16-1050(-)
MPRVHPHAIFGFLLLLICCCWCVSSDPIIGGTPPYRYMYMPDRLHLPVGATPMLNGHGLAVHEPSGEIYFTYQPTEVSESTRALIKFSADGTSAVILGPDNTLAFGVPHGLQISSEKTGVYLYHCNNAATVYKTTLDGDIVWAHNFTNEWAESQYWPFSPTWAVVATPPSSPPTLFVSDGYGSSYVHQLDPSTGKYTGRSFGGPGSSTDPQKFNCPHGIYLDDQSQGQLVVSDRGNSRLQWLDLHGAANTTHNRTFAMPVGFSGGSQPCNYMRRDELAVVPSLDGPVGIYNASGGMELLSVFDAAALLGSACPHPHHSLILPSGDLVLCCWNPGHLSYWKRLSS